MSDMRLVVAGAAGRMGRALIQIVQGTPGAVLAGAIARPGSAAIGQDAGLLAGCGEIGVTITADALRAIVGADGILDFTTPQTTVALATLAAQARIVHVIGTTGLQPDDFARLEAAARHAVMVQSGNMSFGVNLLAALVEKAARALGPDFDIEIVEMHHRAKVDAPSGTALLLGAAAAKGRAIDLAGNAVRSREGHTGARPAGGDRFRHLARRLGRRRPSGHFRGSRRKARTRPYRRRPQHFCPGRRQGCALGSGPQSGPLFDGGRARARWLTKPLAYFSCAFLRANREWFRSKMS